MGVAWQANPYALAMLGSAIIAAAVSVAMHRRRGAPGAGTCAWLMLALAWWSFFHAVELSAADLHGKLFWIKFEYLGILDRADDLAGVRAALHRPRRTVRRPLAGRSCTSCRRCCSCSC